MNDLLIGMINKRLVASLTLLAVATCAEPVAAKTKEAELTSARAPEAKDDATLKQDISKAQKAKAVEEKRADEEARAKAAEKSAGAEKGHDDENAERDGREKEAGQNGVALLDLKCDLLAGCAFGQEQTPVPASEAAYPLQDLDRAQAELDRREATLKHEATIGYGPAYEGAATPRVTDFAPRDGMQISPGLLEDNGRITPWSGQIDRLAAAPIPEPAIWSTMITGFFGTGMMIRKLRRREAAQPSAFKSGVGRAG